MPFPTFTPIVPPVAGTSGSDNYSVLTVAFGDSYSQRMPSGINSVYEEIDLMWQNITFAEMDSIRSFFRSVRGVTPFLFQLPVETTPRTFITTTPLQWQSGPGGITYEVSITIREVFENV